MSDTVNARKVCGICEKVLGEDRFSLLLLSIFDNKGWEYKSEREWEMKCTACQLATVQGAIDLFVAVENADKDVFYPDIVSDVIRELNVNNKLMPTFFREPMISHLVRALYRWRCRANLQRAFDDITNITRQHQFSVCIMRRLAQYTLERLDEALKSYTGDGVEQFKDKYLDFILTTTVVASAVELEDFFTRIDNVYLFQGFYKFCDANWRDASRGY
ncbi:hypothetical protein F4820DRAFT_451939 [Hypoxylon rubiginosum]|uniref:Uncharacterized protein n=1 Tax=Hypoxylon rubiginosum TaxID=110542 RepID=A0ACB9YR35_9PEZI|nr:hypothetical protein F4820DRAFT_451939 [Hypoxylon rubiginosum]